MPSTLLQTALAAKGGDPNLHALNTMVQGIRKQARNSNGNAWVTQDAGAQMIALESLDATSMQSLDTVITGMSTALENILDEVAATLSTTAKKQYTRMQRDAAICAGMVGANMRNFLAMPLERNDPNRANTTFVETAGADMSYSRGQLALEAYDEKENANAVTYSMAYNMSAARQDAFGEAFFPTVIVTPDQIGYFVSIRINSVYQDLRRQVSGELDKFQKRNIIQATIDPTIFNSDNTVVVPVYRDESEWAFVPEAKLAPNTQMVGNESVTTSALAVGKKFSLLAISQTEALLATGLLDTTDALDSSVWLKTVVLEVGDDVFEVEVDRLQFSAWNKSVQGNYRQLSLNFQDGPIRFDKNTKTAANATPTTLSPSVLGNNKVTMTISAFGSINQETSETEVTPGVARVSQILDAAGNVVDLGSSSAAPILAAFASAKMIGFRLKAQRTNSNRRQRGQLLDTTFYNQIYTVPLRGPLTALRPTGIGDENDASDLACLITATNIRTSNDAVQALLDFNKFLKDFIDERDTYETQPKLLGVARDLITAQHRYRPIDVSALLQTLDSIDKIPNIQAVLYNAMRDLVADVYLKSGWQPAADALAGGQAPRPSIIIGTDPYIGSYLNKDGDTRLLGQQFEDVRIVTTWNKNMRGKIFIAFGDFAAGKEGVPNPMHFGNMAWKSEMTLILPIPRNGSYSKELTVTPSYLHIVNNPILIELDVTGINAAASELIPLPVNTNP